MCAREHAREVSMRGYSCAQDAAGEPLPRTTRAADETYVQAPERSGKLTLAIPLRGLGIGHVRSSSAMQSNCVCVDDLVAATPAASTFPLGDT